VVTHQVFLIGGSYRREGEGVVVELFGRTREGRSLTARVYDFKPYFELTEPAAAVREALSRDPDAKLSEERLWVAGREREVLRVEVRYPFTVPEYRRRYERPGDPTSVLACDIPFVHRFLYDRLGSLTVSLEGEPEDEQVRRQYTTELVVRVTGRIEPAEAFRPELVTLSFDIENSLKDRHLLCLCGVVQRGTGEPTSFRLEGEERTILEGFVATVEREDPDLITGYNIGGYDLPLLLERAEALGLAVPPLGRDRAPVGDVGERVWRAHGRVVADAWWSARQILHPKQETLEFVSQLLLGEGKSDVDRRNMDEEWARDRARVLEYCERDALLALRIFQKLRATERAADLATVAHLFLEEGMNGRTSVLVDALLIPAADRARIGVPPTRRMSRESAIEGGYVHALQAQLAHWVVVLDFKSMYPSLIIARNICFSTLSPEGSIVAPNGARFLDPSVRPGLIPRILKDLLGERDLLKRRMREAKDRDEAGYYDGLQNAVKILMNSFYGVLASSFYRFTDKEIGAAITAFARQTIQEVIAALTAQGAQVLYSDTDSIFVRSPEPSLEGARAFGERIAEEFSRAGATLEFQAVYRSFFSHGVKKRYVARQAWPREETVVRGYETRRTDSFDAQSEALSAVFEDILDGDTERAVRHARELIARVQAGEVALEALVIARTVREEGQYNEATRDALPFLRVFKTLQAEGYPVFPGMKVAWVVTNAKKTPQEIEPYAAGRPFPAQKVPDYAYYAERMAQTLARVTEVFGWDAERLLQGTRQSALSDHAGGEGAAPPPTPPAGLDTPAGSLLERPASNPRRSRQTTLG
jgi:DNA polymerase I